MLWREYKKGFSLTVGQFSLSHTTTKIGMISAINLATSATNKKWYYEFKSVLLYI